MDVLFDTSAGIDVHRDTVVVTVRCRRGRRETQETKTFDTFRDGLDAMSEWLAHEQVGVVALESTGVYWMPVARALQERCRSALWLVNPHQVKKVPGRKTDVTDSQWLAKLAMHGLVSPSFLASPVLTELRKLTRFRKRLVADETSVKNRITRELEMSGIKLASVCTDVFGKSGRRMLDALLDGSKTPEVMADLALGLLRKKRALLERALAGQLSNATRLVLRKLLARLDALKADVVELDHAISQLMRPLERERQLLETVPSLSTVSSSAILAEIGGDMSVFPSADHLASWSGLCPGSCESAGKSKRVATRKGDKYLRTMLVEVATCFTLRRARDHFWARKYRQLAPRLGKKKALCAIARRILVAIYYMLRDGKPYEEPTPRPPSPKTVQRTRDRCLEQLQALGYEVTLVPRAA
jgi:transposase